MTTKAGLVSSLYTYSSDYGKITALVVFSQPLARKET
jgi:hypothetical protein